jgi:AraC-like DNA-binding protein
MGGMSSSADHFARFVDVLAEALNDHDADFEELAGRLFLSRYHLSRVVTSVAGEPPAAFRRRILLERAAYRLATTSRSVLDVATEAGYGSHEAFTRAFTRAFGTGPASWRANPTGITLRAPSQVHFQPPGSLRLPAERRTSPMELVLRMVQHHVWLVGEMVERAATLTDEQLDRPIELSVDEDRLTMRALLSRLVGQMHMWNAAVAGTDYDWSLEVHESVASLRSRLAEQGQVFLAHVEHTVAEERLDDTFVDALCDPPEVFTYGGMIAHVLTFAAHRRTLVALALDAAGVPDLGWGDPMRWVAEPAR